MTCDHHAWLWTKENAQIFRKCVDCGQDLDNLRQDPNPTISDFINRERGLVK